MKPRCPACPLDKLKEKTVKERPGYVRGECGVCGKFLGYRVFKVEAEPLIDKPKRKRKGKP